MHGRVGAFYAPYAREGNQILQHCTSKSVDTIRGHSSYGIGISANRLYGFEQFNLQNECRRERTKSRNSSNHLVGLEKEGRGDRQAEGLGGLEVDHQLKLHRLLHR
jgi:hypothetical protein